MGFDNGDYYEIIIHTKFILGVTSIFVIVHSIAKIPHLRGNHPHAGSCTIS